MSLKEKIKAVTGFSKIWSRYEEDALKLKMLAGKKLVQLNKLLPSINSIHDVEFSVFSQWGDDGIIQYLIHKLGLNQSSFVEFGVQNYIESNTRFLLMNNNWRGLVIDASEHDIGVIKKDPIYWNYDITAVCHFINRDNINSILESNGFKGEIGLLHIDIDGNDYWIWDAITTVNPLIVIMEYNSLFGSERPITIPYDKDFYAPEAHYSRIYFGASIKALCLLAEKKGYTFIGSNSNGNNAYFVRNDKASLFKPLTAKEGYVYSRFRQNRNKEGVLTLKSDHETLRTFTGLKVVNVDTGQTEEL